MSNLEPPATTCPPPLMWQDIRRDFQSQSTPHTIECAAGTAGVRSWGSGPALYFLPGFTAPSELFGLMIWLLRDEFRCVTVEPLAVRATHTPAPFGAETDLLLAAADQLGDDGFLVFGANYGAAWGLAAAARCPERITRLLVLQGFLHRRISIWERGLAAWCGWSRRTLGQFPRREFLQAQNHRRWFPPFDATRWQYFLDASGALPLRELSRRAREIARLDLRPVARQIVTPTLVIHTEGDGAIAEACQQELARQLPAVNSEWLHNTGHLAYLTHPHRLAKLVRTFCGS